MAVIPVTFEEDSKEIGQLLISGIVDEKWTLQADARIKTAEDPTGVGPVAYVGRPKDVDNNVDLQEGSPRDVVLVFYTDTNIMRADAFNQEPADITDTVNDFLTNHGGDRTAMIALAPTPA